MNEPSFFWHDYETFGRQPRSDHPAQFAGLRTDTDLNEVGPPVMAYCQPPVDQLADPESCLLTGITPQRCAALGLPQHEFAALVQVVEERQTTADLERPDRGMVFMLEPAVCTDALAGQGPTVLGCGWHCAVHHLRSGLDVL